MLCKYWINVYWMMCALDAVCTVCIRCCMYVLDTVCTGRCVYWMLCALCVWDAVCTARSVH